MVPRIHLTAKSFRGVVEYCLDDKMPEPEEGEKPAPREYQQGDPSWERRIMSDRVAWTQTLNLSADDPYTASGQMAATVKYSTELKKEAGVKAGGRKLEKPVCHYSLSWREFERPSQDEMVSAARSSLRALNMDDRQALLVAHNDKNHAHVHVIVNRVSSTDGRAASLDQSRLTLSRWAERYENWRGKIQCHRRVDHNRRRARGTRYTDRSGSRATSRRHRPPREITRLRFTDGRTPDEHAGVEVMRKEEQQVWNQCHAVLQESHKRLLKQQDQEWYRLLTHQKGERQRFDEYTSSSAFEKEVAEQQRDWREKTGGAVSKEEVMAACREEVLGRQRKERGELSRTQGRARAKLQRQAREYYTKRTAWMAEHAPRSGRAPATLQMVKLAQAIAQIAAERRPAPGGGATPKTFNPFETEEERRQRERSLDLEI